MRPIAATVSSAGEASYNLSFHHPAAPATSTTCEPDTCRWRPYSSSNELETNAAMVLIILLCALICALALNAAIRCFLRGAGTLSHQTTTAQEVDIEQQGKPTPEAAAPPLVVVETVQFSEWMMKQLAECAICLSEFVEGERLQVLGRCKHGFHEHCIQNWLSSHYSCPTCRTSCLALSSEQNAASSCTDLNQSEGATSSLI